MAYERLTERMDDGQGNPNCSECEHNKMCGDEYYCDDGESCYQKIFDRLAELEDKIEQGTLIELPCKVGDTVYVRGYTWDYYNSFFNQEFISKEIFVVGKITSIRITKKQILIKVKATYRENKRLYKKKDYPISAIGETVFLTREEAEKRLKR